MKQEYKLIAIWIIIGIFSGAIGALLINKLLPKSSNDNIASFYSVENSVGVSPSDYVNGLTSGTLVDLRDNYSYNSGHMQGAINIPATQMTYSQVLDAFSNLPKDKPIILYCYSSYCMLSVEVGNFLAQHGIYAKHFNLGWAELKQDFPNYVVNGTEPGKLNINSSSLVGGCSSNEGFGC